MCTFDKLGLLSIIVVSLIVVLGIVHLGVGIGIVSEYREYDDVFRQSVGLAGYNIVIGIFATAVGVLGAFVILKEKRSLKKITLLTSAIVGVFTLASLISAMAINSQSISYIRTHLSNRMNSYVQDEESIYVTDKVQRDFQCCGVHLWLDWARLSLGSVLRTTHSNTTATSLSNFSTSSSLLKRSLQLKTEQMARAQTFYNFPSSYSVTLPLSCCKNGALTSGNAISGYCIYSANNGTTNFYITGCLAEVANTAVSQISGFILINTILTIMTFVFVPIVMNLFAEKNDSNTGKYPNFIPAGPSPPIVTNVGQLNASPSYFQSSNSQNFNPNAYHNYNTPMYRYYS